MKRILLIAVFVFMAKITLAQTELRGGINVWNNSGTTISLLDDFYYQLAPGDELSVTITGSANIAPRDEERKGGGFLGLFKKSYNVRIDDWKPADLVQIVVQVGTYGPIALTVDGVSHSQTGTFTIPQATAVLQTELLTNCKLNAWINQYMTPLRAGRYEIVVKIDSRKRLDLLKTYLESLTLPIINFENDIKAYIENGKLIYKHPNETVKIVGDALANKPNIEGIKKDLYKYLLRFAPENTSVRAGLAEVYLKELNFSEAQVEAQQTIVLLSKKTPESLSTNEMNDFGRAYEVVAGVNELKELGLQENAYSVGSVFYGESAKWYSKAKSKDEYTRALMKQVRCLQKVGDVIALKQAANILLVFDTEIRR